MAKELVYRVRVTTDQKAFADFRRSAVSGQKDVEKSIRNTTNELNRQIELLDLYRQKGDITSEELSQGFEEIEQRLKDLPVATRDVIRSQKKLLKAQQQVSGSTGVMRNTISGANQTLFSFGDIINDAQQFQFGFAQGSRAIGNNIAFMAEQFSNVSNRAGGFSGALRAMGRSLMGPGGIIIGINLAVSALTIFGDELFGTKEKVVSLDGALDSAIDRIIELRDISNAGIFGTEEAQQQLDITQQAIKDINDLISEAEEREPDNLTQFFATLAATGDVTGALQATLTTSADIAELQAALNILKEREKELQEEITASQILQKTTIDETVEALEKEAGEAFRRSLTEQILNDDLLDDIENFNKEVAERVNKGVVFGGEAEETRADELNRQLDNFRRVNRAELQLARITAQKRVAIEQATISAIGTLRQQFAQNSKPFALALLAIEKGLAISGVLVDATQKAAQATAQGLLFLSNPATAPLAAQAFSAAAAIKANAAVAAGIIAAQGLAEGAGILTGGGAGSAGGGTVGGAAQSTGFNSGQRNTLDSASSFGRGRERRNISGLMSKEKPQINLNVTNKIDRKGAALLIRDGERELKTDLISK